MVRRKMKSFWLAALSAFLPFLLMVEGRAHD
jgi:hypothetical protein